MSLDAFFKNLPMIETERLLLRQIRDNESDGRDALEYINDYNVYRFWGLYDEPNDPEGTNRPKAITELDYHYKEITKEYQEGHELTWLMELKENHKVIGEIVLYDFQLKRQADIGYRINSSYWGKGYAPEAGQAMLWIAFEHMGLTRLQIRCFKQNEGSAKVALKLGFTQEGLIRQGAILNVMTDYYIFGYLYEDYRRTKPRSEGIKINQ